MIKALLLREECAMNLHAMNEAFHEPVKKKVGGSLSRISPLRRLAMLQKNALLLRGGKWQAPKDDGTLVRKVVGKTR